MRFIHYIYKYTPIDSLFLAILLVKQKFKLVWPEGGGVIAGFYGSKHSWNAFNFTVSPGNIRKSLQ